MSKNKKKWSQIKSKFEEKKMFWMKLAKNTGEHTDENIESNFLGVDNCFMFYCRKMNQEELLSLPENLGDLENQNENDIMKILLKNTEYLIDNYVFNCSNVLTSDFIDTDDCEELEFDKDMIKELLNSDLKLKITFIHLFLNYTSESIKNVENQKKT